MEQNWESLTQKFTEMIESASDLSSIESIRVELLGKKGQIASLMANMATISKEEKKNYGMAVNSLKQKTEKLLSEKIEQLKEKDMLEKIQQEKIDITLPASRVKYGTKHPLTIVREEIEDIFMKMGYSVYNGPEVELDFYNFERANIPADHPAMQLANRVAQVAPPAGGRLAFHVPSHKGNMAVMGSGHWKLAVTTVPGP